MNYLFQRFGKRAVIIYLLVILTLVGIVAGVLYQQDASTNEESRLPGVRVANVGALSGSSELSLVGTVSSVSEVKLESEVSGRITSVPVTLGQTVEAGTIIASIENSAEYAAVLQAEGSYESALAAAAKSNIGVEDARTTLLTAKQTAINANRGAITTSTSIILSTLDNFFTNPRSPTPGLRVNVTLSSQVNDERYKFNAMLDEWQREVANMNTLDDTDLHEVYLNSAIEKISRVSSMVDVFIKALPKQSPDEIFTEATIAELQVSLSTAKSSLNSQISTLESAINGLKNAEQALASAELSGTSSNLSAANASVKQALGVLKAAQASYNKTIIRTPIGGTLNTLAVKTGDYIAPGTFVANVANNDASVIKTFISDSDRDRVTLGQEVTINGNASGTVVAIAPGIDPVTKKAQVDINSDSSTLVNGATVRVIIPAQEDTTRVEDNSPIIIPVSALKVEANRKVVFILKDDQTLVAQEVKEGTLQGTSIIIESGLTRDMNIVTDARGLNEGDKVEVIQ